MEAVRGEIFRRKSPPAGGAPTACRVPHLAQKVSDGWTWLPHCVQNGILLVTTIRQDLSFRESYFAGSFAQRKPISGARYRAGTEDHSHGTAAIRGLPKDPPFTLYQGSFIAGGGLRIFEK